MSHLAGILTRFDSFERAESSTATQTRAPAGAIHTRTPDDVVAPIVTPFSLRSQQVSEAFVQTLMRLYDEVSTHTAFDWEEPPDQIPAALSSARWMFEAPPDVQQAGSGGFSVSVRIRPVLALPSAP